MSDREYNQILAASFLGMGLLLVCTAALIEKRWPGAASTIGIVGVSMWVMSFITGVTA